MRMPTTFRSAIRADFLVQWIYPCLLGLVIGFAAWGPGRMPLVSMAMPLFMAIAPSRRQAMFTACAYVAATQWDMREVVMANSSWSAPAPLAAWIVAPLIGGVAWSLHWTRSSKPWRKALACLIGWLAVTLPPAGDVAWGSSLVGWGYVVPGFGWGGVVLSAAAPALVMYQVAAKKEPPRMTRIWVSVLALLLVAASFATRAFESRFVQDIVGVSTRWTPASPQQFLEQHLQSVSHTAQQLASEKLASVMVYPAGVVQAAAGEDLQPIKSALASVSKATAMTIILGVDVAREGRAAQRSALVIFPDGRSEMVQGKLLDGTVKAFLPANTGQTLQLKAGLQVHVIAGGQHAYPLPMLVSEGLSHAPLVIALLDTHPLGVTQTHIQGMALLFGQKLVVAGIKPKYQGAAND